MNLQKILVRLEDISASKVSSKPSDPRTLPTDMTLLQVFSAINDLKLQFGLHDQVLGFGLFFVFTDTSTNLAGSSSLNKSLHLAAALGVMTIFKTINTTDQTVAGQSSVACTKKFFDNHK